MNIVKVKMLGTYWEKNGNYRYYFNNINLIMGLRFTYQKNGGRKHRAYLNNKQIPLSEANKLDCTNCKIYYDVKLGMLRYPEDVDFRILKVLSKVLA